MFYPGTHGHYIDFVLNTLATKKKYVDSPIDPAGTFHNITDNDTFIKNSVFKCFHPDSLKNFGMYIDPIKAIKKDEFFVKINFGPEEDVTAQQLSLRRGVYPIDMDSITKNTYNKLMVLSADESLKIIDNINQYSDITPYNNIKDPSWPNISSVDDFWNLPEHIINECVSVFNFTPFYLDENNTDAPEWVLRDLFKYWLHQGTPSEMPDFAVCNNTQFPNMYSLPLRNIYDIELFKQELVKIGNWCGLNFDLAYFSEAIHNDYVSKLPIKNSRQLCESVFDAVKNNEYLPISLNINEESYIEYLCEKYFKIKFPMFKKDFFKDTKELKKYIDNEIHS
jgi:hypothetical protein